MGRMPDSTEAREVPVTTRMTESEKYKAAQQTAYRGFSTRSAYIRWLIREDGKRIEREKGS